MLSRFRGLCAALFITALSLCANGAENLSPLPAIQEGQLANGLHYTLVPLTTDKGRVDIRLTVDAGSLDETPQQSGVAHMVEHMVFRASRAWPEGVAAALGRQGWQRGIHYNAMTNYERTLYMFSPPNGVSELPLALKALDQMTRHAQLTQRDLDDERKVILEEWRGKLGVAERMNQQRVAAIRADSRYPQRPVIGTEASIRHTPASALQDFYQRWYHPNAMRLMIIGDIDTAQVAAQIARQFGDAPAVTLPPRDSYDPALKPQRRLVRLQDSESGTSQVSLVTRFTEAYGAGPARYRDRLINQLTTTLLTRQLRRQRDTLPPQVGNIVARKSDIGRQTVAFALFADVIPGKHLDGLTALFQQREQLKRYGLASEEIEQERLRLLALARKMKTEPEARSFADWVRLLNSSWLNKSRYFPAQARGAAAEQALATITPDDVNARLRQWLTAPDTLIQFTFPGASNWPLPTASTVQAIEKRAGESKLTPPLPPTPVVLPTLPESGAAGARTGVKIYPRQQVEEWRLSNGDRLVWLRTPLAGKQVWFTARSAAGYLADGLTPWQAQLAAQMIAPAGWQSEALQAWKKQHKLALSVDQQAQTLEVTGQASQAQLAQLLHLYQALQLAPGIDAEAMKSSLLPFSRRLVMQASSRSARRENDIVTLRFGQPAFAQPTPAQLAALTPASLLTQWRQATRAPVTYFILADLPAETLHAAAARYLAAIPRVAPLRAPAWRQLPGKREKTAPLNIEPKADVSLWSFTDAAWTPELAVQVSIARNLMNQHLKRVLRDEQRGIYNMRFNSELSDTRGRIETEMRFTASPQRVDELAHRAAAALQDFSVTPQAIAAQRAQFIRTEQQRAQDIATLNRRLLLSYAHFDNPGYLSRIERLPDAITLEGVSSAASRLFNPQNQALYIALPQEKTQ